MKFTLLTAAIMFAQQPSQAPPVKAPPVKAWPSFRDAKSYPVVVFVGAEPRSVPGLTSAHEKSGWNGIEGPAVVVYTGGKLGQKFAPTITDYEIRVAAGMEVSRQATPFSQQSAQPEVQVDGASLAQYVKEGARFYSLRPLYQKMYTMSSRPYNDPTTIHDAEGPEHHPFVVSGGMAGLSGWRSDKALYIPEGSKVEVWQQGEDVRAFATTYRWRWKFPPGTIAYDVLSTDRGVFEVRTQERTEDGWETKVTHREEANRPEGYAGLKQACSSCHSHTGEIVDVPGRIYRRERWGSDGRFSWRPYDESGRLDSSWPLEVR